MKNPFSNGPSKAEKRYRQDLQRWRQMAQASGNEADRAVLRSQPREVIELVGPKIEERFSIQTKDCGQVFPIEEKDHAGRDVTKYFGDIKAAFKESLIPATPIKIAETVWHRGFPYIKSQLPAWVRAERAMAEIGTRPEQGAPVGSGE